jgi:hypothetical protein
MRIPARSSLLGSGYRIQGVVLDPPANGFAVTFTEAADLVVGTP